MSAIRLPDCAAKVRKKSHMRKGYAFFLCKVYGVKCKDGDLLAGKSASTGLVVEAYSAN